MTKVQTFPFFVGCDRSGTTLVRSIFDSHSNLSIPGESYFIAGLNRKRKSYETPQGFNLRHFTADLFQHKYFCRWNLSEDQVTNALNTASITSYADAIRQLFSLYANLQGKTRYADKTPSYVQHMPLLAELFPEARFIHIIRDGRNVALSIQEIGIKEKCNRYSNLGECILHWKERVELGRTFGHRLGFDRYIEIYYEDLLDNPKQVVQRICDFINLDFQDSMLRYSERAEELAASFLDPSIQKNLFLPPTKGLRDWQSQMSSQDIALFEVLAGELSNQCGYQPASKPSDIRLHLNAKLYRLHLQIRHITRQLHQRLSRTKNTILNTVKV
jgi:hypothetical protein